MGRAPYAIFPDRRLRTILQSIDTARFHDDRNIDRIIDIDQARSEILSAVLFGYEVVVPAGLVADSPAVKALVPEVLQSFEPARRRISDLTGNNYYPFRLGFEAQYLDGDPKGYDTFIRGYIRDERENLSRHVEIEPFAREVGRKKAVVALAEAYLGRRWGDIAARNPDYAVYMEQIYRWFGETGDASSSPISCATGALTRAPGKAYVNNINASLKNLKARHSGLYDMHASKIRGCVKAAYGKIVDRKADPGQRGSWYGTSEYFEEQEVWNFVRIWADDALYKRINSAYRIDVPSYFQQECSASVEGRVLALSHLKDELYNQYNFSNQGQQPILLPAAAKVDWRKIWGFMSDEDVQVMVGQLHQAVRDAQSAARSELRRGIPNSEVRKRYKIKVFNALDHYIAFLNDGQSVLNFTRNHGHLVIDVEGKNRRAISERLKNSIGYAITLGLGLAAAEIPTVGFLAAAGLITAGHLSEKLWSHAAIHVISEVRRPSNDSVFSQEEFYNAERDRVNFWIST